jgi:hypothetical protein
LSATCAPYYPECSSGSSYQPAQTYIAPPAPTCIKPTLTSLEGSPSFSQTSDCKQNLTFEWQKGVLDEFYSVALSKKQGSDPGSNINSRETKFSFSNVSSGIWYVNVKPGRSCGWGKVYNWKINVPIVSPSAFFGEKVISEDERQLVFSTTCSTEVSISPEIGKLSTQQLKDSYVTIHPKQDTTYMITASNGEGIATGTLNVQAKLPQPSFSPIPTESSSMPLKEEQQTKEQSGSGTPLLSASAIGGGYYWWTKRKDKVNNK